MDTLLEDSGKPGPLTKTYEPREGNIMPEDNLVLNIASEPPNHHTHLSKKPVFVLYHPKNDGPTDPEKDVYYNKEMNATQPICSFFQHSVLGTDFGANTFPHVSFVSSETLPFRVHYAPDDELRFESYKWPFAACNHACELQSLTIRALFDWELDPVNEDSHLDEGTQHALLVAREICQWKNARRFFAFDNYSKSDLRKRFVQISASDSLSGNVTYIALSRSL